MVIISVAVVLWVRLPPTPVTVRLNVPLTPETVWIVSVELDVVGLGAKVAVAPAGSPLTLRFTDPLKPFAGVTATV